MVSALTIVSSPVGRATFPGALAPGIGTIMQSEQTSEGIDLALLTPVERRNLGVDSKPKKGRPVKYGQPTVRVSVRLPADIVAAIDAQGARTAVVVKILQKALQTAK